MVFDTSPESVSNVRADLLTLAEKHRTDHVVAQAMRRAEELVRGLVEQRDAALLGRALVMNNSSATIRELTQQVTALKKELMEKGGC
jgi:hypothetical protein